MPWFPYDDVVTVDFAFIGTPPPLFASPAADQALVLRFRFFAQPQLIKPLAALVFAQIKTNGDIDIDAAVADIREQRPDLKVQASLICLLHPPETSLTALKGILPDSGLLRCLSGLEQVAPAAVLAFTPQVRVDLYRREPSPVGFRAIKERPKPKATLELRLSPHNPQAGAPRRYFKWQVNEAGAWDSLVENDFIPAGLDSLPIIRAISNPDNARCEVSLIDIHCTSAREWHLWQPATQPLRLQAKAKPKPNTHTPFLFYVGLALMMAVAACRYRGWDVPLFDGYQRAFELAFGLALSGAAYTALARRMAYLRYPILVTLLAGFALNYQWLDEKMALAALDMGLLITSAAITPGLMGILALVLGLGVAAAKVTTGVNLIDQGDALIAHSAGAAGMVCGAALLYAQRRANRTLRQLQLTGNADFSLNADEKRVLWVWIPLVSGLYFGWPYLKHYPLVVFAYPLYPPLPLILVALLITSHTIRAFCLKAGKGLAVVAVICLRAVGVIWGMKYF